MKTVTRLGLYGLALVAVFGLAAAIGAGVGPINVGASSSHSSMSSMGPEGASAAQIATVDGFSISLTRSASAGESSLTFDVARDGEAVVTEPYLGSTGHLVVIRESDFGYMRVHPVGGAPGAVRFMAEFPSMDRYRLFFDFSVAGVVHTALFAVAAGGES